MEEKKVLIDINSTVNDGESDDTVQITTTGTFSGDTKKFRLNYSESGDNGFDGCLVTVSADGGIVKISREGAFNSELIIEEGCRHTCTYGTPYGSFTVGVSGESVKFFYKNGVLFAELNYAIDVNTSMVSENILCIKIKEC